MKLSSTHQLKRQRPQPVIKQHLLGSSHTYKKNKPWKSKLRKKAPRTREPCSGRVKKGLASQRGAV